MDNRRLDRTELRLIFADGQHEAIRLERRLQAIVTKLAGIVAEVEDEHSRQVILHLGRRVDDVEIEVWKKGY